jgi:AcrR family transcriptional regulator
MGRKKNFEREDVLDKALGLFWKKGFADTSVQDLEKVTGVNKSGLYSEFKDKEDLYASALKQYLTKATIQDLFQTEPLGWGNIEKFLRLPLTCSGTKGCFAASSIRESKILPSQARNALSTHLSDVRDLLVMNLKGNVKSKPELVADMILSFHNGVALELNLQTAENLSERIELFISTIKKV